jgi:hypothetical protein
MEYDDEREFTRYVWDYYQHLMTDLERRVGVAISARVKAAASSSPAIAHALNERWGCAGDLEVEAALSEGPEAFRRRVSRRVLAEHNSVVVVNRCPKCRRVLRTPQARQCFWCGHDWHAVRA